MDGCEPRFLPEWLKGTSSEKRVGASTHLDPSASSKINSAEGFRNATERISTNKSWRRSTSNIRKNHHHCERDGFSNLQDYGSFQRSYSEGSRDLNGKEKEPTNHNRPDAVLNTRASCTNMNCTSQVNRDPNSCGASRRSSASPLGNRTQSNLLLRRSRSFGLDDGSVDSSGKLQESVSNANHTSHSVLPNKMPKASFDRDFPVLPVDLRSGAVDSSPRTTSLSASSRLICNAYGFSSIRPNWKSALAEPPSFASVAPSENGLNYCLSVQNVVTSRLGTLIQKSDYENNLQSQVEPHKMEEMTLKQSRVSRQLIPAAPSMPKGMHGIGYCKGKSSSYVNMSTTVNSGNSSKPKSPSSTHGGGRLPVLKTATDHLVSTNKSSNPDQLKTVKNLNSGNTSVSHKRVDSAASLYAEQKKPTRKSLKERNAFFSSLRQKSECSSLKNGFSSPEIQSMTKLDECDESEFSGSKDGILESAVLLEASNNGDDKQGFTRFEDNSAPTVPNHRESVIPAEEEAFLRRLGWDEGAGGDEALTEEEINSFILQHMQAVLSKSMLRGKSAWKLSALRMHEMRVGNVGSVSSD